MTSTTSKIGNTPGGHRRTGGKAAAAKAFLDTKTGQSRGGMTSTQAKSRAASALSNDVELLKKMRTYNGKAYTRQTAGRKVAEAIALATAAGTPTRLVLDIDASGKTLLEILELAPPAGPAFPVEPLAEADDELNSALSAARERGRTRAADILAGEDMVSADALAERLGTTRTTINSKRQKGEILALDGAKRGFRFPVWQIDDNGKPFGQLSRLHDMLGGPWAVYRFLVQRLGELDGLTGREALEKGMIEEVFSAAESAGRDFR